MPEREHMTEYEKKVEALAEEAEVLDALFEAIPGLPHDGRVGVSLYPSRDANPRAEMYVRLDGKCWRITATPHPHPDHAIPPEKVGE